MSSVGMRTRRPLIVVLTVSALILALSTYIASIQKLPLWEQNLFTKIFNLPSSLYNISTFITLFGSGWMVIGLVLTLIIIKRRELALQVFILSSITYLIVQFMKDTIARPRPIGLVSDLTLKQYEATGFGFPSGHSALSMVCALVILPYVSLPYSAFSSLGRVFKLAIRDSRVLLLRICFFISSVSNSALSASLACSIEIVEVDILGLL